MSARVFSMPDLLRVAPPGPTLFGFGGALDPTWPLRCAAGDLEPGPPPWACTGLSAPPTFWSVDYSPSSEALADKLLEVGHAIHLHTGAHAPGPCGANYRASWRRRWRISHLTMRVPTAARFPDEVRGPLREATQRAERCAWAPPLSVPWDVAMVELHVVFGERSEGREATLRFAFSPFEGALFARHALPHGLWPLAGVATTRQAFAQTRSYGALLASRELGQVLVDVAPLACRPLMLVGDQGVQHYPGRVTSTGQGMPDWGYAGVRIYRWAPPSSTAHDRWHQVQQPSRLLSHTPLTATTGTSSR